MGCGPNQCRKAATVDISVSTVRLVALEAAMSQRKRASRRRRLAATKALWTDVAAPAAARRRQGAGPPSNDRVRVRSSCPIAF
jgi:hypothetical protein